MKNSIPWLFLFLLVAFESSGQFNLFPPSITAQRTLSVNQNGSIAIDFNDITVVDLLQLPAYPIGYTMSLTSPGDHYTALSNVVTPERNYNGNITVPITVNDGTFTSEPWPLVIRVVKVDNIVPVIEGPIARLSAPHATPIVLKLTDLKVTDPDNVYPDEFTMNVKSGPNYRRNQLTVTPDANFSGTLTVNVTVKDTEDESAEFPVVIEVLPPANQKPVITATTPLTTTVGTPVTVAFGDLTVTDDNPYPGIFTMTLYDGPGYTHSGRIITPTGTTATTLSVPVSVNDGSLESDLSNITVQVNPRPNIKPKITGPAVALSTFINTPLTLTLDELTVEDPDNVYPTDFTLKVSAGTNCTVSGSTITPTPGFTGNMTVSVIVNDKTIDSDPVTLTIPVNPRPNIKPKINGTTIAFTTFVNTAITIPLTTLVVEDPDNNFPSDFTMQLYAGQNYTFSNNTVTPAPSFKGELKVPVTVFDGKATSDPFVITVEVSEKPTVAPKITGQDALKTFISTPIMLKVTNLRIDDADTSYPDGFTIKILDGAGYSHTANTITPNLLFIGKLKVPITVSDGINESPRFDLEITVDILPNVAPRITASKDLSTFVGQPVKIELSDLSVTDPDNTYPGSFKLTLYKGDNYNFSNTTVTPSAGFDGLIKVTVSVNDGTAESNSWEVNINVTKSPNVAPVIAGQKTNPYGVDEDKPLTLTLDMLTVTDPDNTFPTDFKLKILPPLASANYSVNGDIITPSLNFNGDLNVRVSVNDGTADSAPYNLKVKVNPVNDPPIVTSQLPLSTQVATAIELKLSQLTISDPDNTTFTFKVNDVNDRSGYTVSGNTITPAAGFKGELKVSVSISDGTATIQHNMIVAVVDKPNTPPVITAQKPKPLIAVMNTPLTITNINLEVTDPDKQQFQIATISPGANYTATGATITPGNNYTGPLTVPITVTDGTASSAPFNLEITVVAPSARPQIVGQSPIAANEDEPFIIRLQDLVVTDTDDQYPNGFKLQIVNSPAYTYTGNSVTAAKDFNGFLQVLVTVTDDGGQVSNQYGVAVLVSPVNDAPVISQFETNSLSYQPGKDPIVVTSQFEVTDVDNEYLSFAEISIEKEKYQKGHDQLLFTPTSNIRGIFDDVSGKLSLLGYAPIADYQAAIRNIQYNFILADVEAGEPEVLPTDKKITFSVHDGQKDSEPKSRNIIMETNVSIRIPTAFSPNDDRFNATWQVIALSNKQQLENAIVKVYDKRGLLLFESKGVERQWDGKYNGQPLPSDTYFYTVDLMLTYAKKTYKGAVTLLR